MARVRTVFYGSELSGEELTELKCFVDADNEITLSIENLSYPTQYISLDKETAIKLVKHLKQQIGIVNANQLGE